MQNDVDFSALILDWFDQHGRKDLPWQKDIHPYRVWVSEIMLQQTQVKTVIPYFERFIKRFPTVECLANAKEDEALVYWSGLGYYARARNLYQTAKIIQQDFNGKFPLDLQVLQTLPGIGRSTAGAILAIAGGQKAAILDGNVKRVLTRFHGIAKWPGEPETLQKLWEIAERDTPVQRVADYTQAIMDLGATVCNKNPQCLLCPLNQFCHAHQTGTTANYPVKKTKKQLPCRSTIMVILQHGAKILLQKRPSAGIWGGLWSFPESDVDHKDVDHKNGAVKNVMIEKIYQDFGCKVADFTLWPVFRHTFSHFHLDIMPLVAKVNEIGQLLMEDNQCMWYSLNQHEPALPAPVKKILSWIRGETIL